MKSTAVSAKYAIHAHRTTWNTAAHHNHNVPPLISRVCVGASHLGSADCIVTWARFVCAREWWWRKTKAVLLPKASKDDAKAAGAVVSCRAEKRTTSAMTHMQSRMPML